jgi:hypothetical protein
MLLALTLAFGQYLVAALAVLLVLQPLLGAPDVMACLIEVAYEGGHGSAAAMGPTYARLGLESGEALGLALATVGLLASTLVGGLLVLLGRSRGWVRGGAAAGATADPQASAPVVADPAISGSAVMAMDPASSGAAAGTPDQEQPGSCEAIAPALSGRQPLTAAQPGNQPPQSLPPEAELPAQGTPDGRFQPQSPPSDPSAAQPGATDRPPSTAALSPAGFAVNLAFTGSAVLIGVTMLEGLKLLAAWQGGLLAMVVDALPVFPLALLGSLLVRLALERGGRTDLVLPKLQARIGTLSADLLITAATACLDLSLLVRDWLPLTVLAAVGLIWNLAVILLLAPRLLPPSWFERALVEFGQATGVAASGLLLLNLVDPADNNDSLTPFSIKQLILQPFLAGGVITVVAPLAVTSWGLPVWTGLCLALVTLFILAGLWLGRSRAAW